jgi:N-hydroxyarylamine O-acetyltransferase
MQSIHTQEKEPEQLVSGIDLDAYFGRIGYTGGRTSTLETLRTIQLLHAQTIPFESLNPLLRLPVLLDIDALQQKMVQSGRGGYCFEHNLLLSHALKALGFRVRGLAARVLWNLPEGQVKAISHMVLNVEAGDEWYLVDVGFGGLTPTGPLRLELNTAQTTPHELFRLIESDEELVLQASVQDQWKPLYRFTLREHLLPDYEMFSWYLCTHPNSYFRTSLSAARPFPNGRYALRNTALTTHHLGRESEQRELTSVAEFRTILEETFGITLPETPDLDPVLQRLIDEAAETK